MTLTIFNTLLAKIYNYFFSVNIVSVLFKQLSYNGLLFTEFFIYWKTAMYKYGIRLLHLIQLKHEVKFFLPFYFFFKIYQFSEWKFNFQQYSDNQGIGFMFWEKIKP